MPNNLVWPQELANGHNAQTCNWSHSGSNLALDFHGDPSAARVTLLSDGNHHMALQETLSGFVNQNIDVNDIFYVTLPPQVLLQIIKNDGLYLGHLRIPVRPNIMLSPPAIIAKLLECGKLSQSVPFIKNRGNVFLVRKGNPKNIFGVADIFRDDVRLFISNANTEQASHIGYRNTLINIAKRDNLQSNELENWIDNESGRIMVGQSVHHREAPQALFDNQCDVAILYFHLALRFTRIFPEEFELIPLGGTIDDPKPGPDNVVSSIYAGLFDDGEIWGEKLFHYLQSQAVKDIYTKHGLQEL